jgi:hypothetical protein
MYMSHIWLLGTSIIIPSVFVQCDSKSLGITEQVKCNIPEMSEIKAVASGAQSTTTEDHHTTEDFHDSDDEPMVHSTPRDYKTWARQERERMIAEGTDPKDVMMQSEVFRHQPGETPEEMTKRIKATFKEVRSRGVMVLNDMCVADVKPDTFQIGGRRFVLGPKSGVTKGEYRQFGEWFARMAEQGDELREEVPEKFLKFEQPIDDTDDQDRFPRR